MSHTKENIDEIEQCPKFTLYQIVSDYADISGELSPEDVLFCMMMLCGYAGAAAYRASYHTTASVASSACLASRKIREPYIQDLLGRINENYWLGQIVLKTDCYKGKSKQWPKWMPPKKKNLCPNEI